ncbi:enoyl-CoA hydratase [Filimonas lacunae]|uniref:Enoyl-CoA hydratase n=1 Tax=Filimonas lacunae TaxID=477680 RepID=A0A173MNM1_9BACT|nr:enoyl-CoA hydratase-related protein [Filimonas lacunae]BAV08991.1 enoyl-CoA hydratase [Filimonas lacunae]SIS65393.1 enoyl-CoA hydratase [Filimonas lacunae]
MEVVTALENGIYTITINRPDKLNALNRDVINGLSEALNEVYNNPDIKSAILTGAGNKAFVAGADISEFTELDAAGGEELARRGQQLVFDKIENSPKPIVAAVNGYALGGGCELALACHFIIASDNARFGQPEVNLGLIPGYGGTQRLTQAVGKGRAMQLIMTGETFAAQQAMEYGVVNEVVAPDALLEKVKNILLVIHSKAPLAIAKVIESINHFDHTHKGYDFEIKKFGECFGTEDKKEGAAAFLEKRKPVFKGR